MATALPDTDSDFSDEGQSPLDAPFNKAAEHLRKITNSLSNDQLLELYGLYKQGTEGKCNIPKPSWFDGRGRKKWEAWDALGDLSPDEAKVKYVELMQKIDPECNILDDKGPKEAWVAVSSFQRSPSPEHDKSTPLIEAARGDDGDLVTKLLKTDSECAQEKDSEGLTALHWAADRNATKALQAAIKGGCPINATDDTGQTALHYAVSCGHVESTKILVEAGAKLIEDEDGCTPLDLATENEVKVILESAQKAQSV